MTATHKRAFIEFLLEQGVLKFGDFTLKSGRQSPYFFNLGEVSNGPGFATLGEAYAQRIVQAELEFDVLFGPAYKGIPIAVATATALAARNINVGVAYNRKEAKAHGEGGSLVGAAVKGRVLLVDDVLTSGKAIREALALIDRSEAEVVGAVIALDRQEIGPEQEGDKVGGVTAVDALAEEIGAPVMSIANLANLIEYLEGQGSFAEILERMQNYRQQYCVA